MQKKNWSVSDSLIQGSNSRKAKKENTKPNSQKALGSLTSTVVNVGAQSTIHSSQPESSNVSLGAGYVTTWHVLNTSMNSKTKLRCHCLRDRRLRNLIKCICYVCRKRSVVWVFEVFLIVLVLDGVQGETLGGNSLKLSLLLEDSTWIEIENGQLSLFPLSCQKIGKIGHRT